MKKDFRKTSSQSDTRINGDIRCDKVRLVSQDGEALGVMSSQDALYKAQQVGLDLVEVSPNASPPVCKIMDYGKYRYEQQKKKNLAKKKQKTVEIKEIKIRPNIDQHDFDVKLRKIRAFLDDGNKVKVTLRFRGREMMYQNLGAQVMTKIKEQTDDIAKVEVEPKLEGRQVMMVLVKK